MKQGFQIPYLIQKYTIVFLLIFLFLNSTSTAQLSIKGVVRDPTSNLALPFTAVTIADKDSTLISFTRCGKLGQFTITNLKPGDYLIIISHPAYLPIYKQLKLSDRDPYDLGIIHLMVSPETLEPVIVTPRSEAPRMNGDTLEYNTTNIKTKVNAAVEGLLRRLPGVHIDKDGIITVNGEKIERLLVDGEEFFGGDARLITKNLNADMIAKVQVLDKKSDQAQFTGINDGQTKKTLNLTLKADRKNGLITKVEAGGEPKQYYNINSMLGSFKGKRQIAGLGIMANNGATGFTGSSGENGAILQINNGSSDPLGASAGFGIPKLIAGSLHYANKWQGNGDHMVGNYQYGNILTHPYSSSITKQIIQESIYTQSQNDRSDNQMDQHGISADYDYIPDSLSMFRFSIRGITTHEGNQLTSIGSSNFNDTVANSYKRQISDNVNSENYHGTIMWRRQLSNNKNQVLSLIFDMGHRSNIANGYLNARNNFYSSTGIVTSTDSVDQKKSFNTTGLFLNTSLNYTHPILKALTLALSYNLSLDNSTTIQSTYNKTNDKYNQFIDSLSSNFQNNMTSQKVIINLQHYSKKLGYTIGSDLISFSNRQKDKLNKSEINHTYPIWSPHLNMFYNITSSKGFIFNYKGVTNVPAISQLQPTRNNNDPLHVMIGNPDLHPAFTHNLSTSYHNYRPIILNIGLDYSISTSDITTKTYIDSLGRQVSQAANIQGSNRGSFRLMIGKNIKSIDLSITNTISLERTRNFVNENISTNKNVTWAGELSASQYLADQFNFQVNANLGYIHTASSLNQAATIQYWNQTYTGQFSTFLLPGSEISTNINYAWRQKINALDINNTNTYWNFYITRNFFSNRLELRWQINDILNQNSGITRSVSANQFSESSYNVIGRYWLVSAVYRFVSNQNKNPSK